MRLSSIKLAGFKSFVEPTTLLLPGQLVGVVGPNGCGKSNVMDAVRWVLGESRASELRGQSMQDVIFNGTTQRKPAQRASVELVFDNDDHRISGPFGQFKEVSVKRTLTREGHSSYFINQQLVRRKDVQDLFLGTGLGPRAYAIIGQGTISRIIESHPDELRLFLEEAAGVSKYKERRRETESRLVDAQENLTRVQDILQELQSQLSKLEAQAEVATRYRTWSDELHAQQQTLWHFKAAIAQQEAQTAQQAQHKAQCALDAQQTQLTHLQTEIETLNQAHYQAGDALNQSQGLLYEVKSQVSRCHNEIELMQKARQGIQERLTYLHDQKGQTVRRLDAWQDAFQQATERLNQTQSHWQTQQSVLQSHCEQKASHQTGFEQARRALQAQQETRHQAQQAMQLLAQEIKHLQAQHQQSQQRLTQQQAELAKCQLQMPSPQTLAQAQEAWQSAALAHQSAQDHLTQQQDVFQQARSIEQTHHQHHVDCTQVRTQLQAHLDALESLQTRLKVNQDLQTWLDGQGWGSSPALWEGLQVEPGWENAVEAALRERLFARPVSQTEMLQTWPQTAALPPSKLAIYTLSSHDLPEGNSQEPPLEPELFVPGCHPLWERVKAQSQQETALLKTWLHGCWTSQTWEDAWGLRASLQAGQTVYLPCGHAFTSHGIGFHVADNPQEGLMARAQEMDSLRQKLDAQTLTCAQAKTAWQAAQQAAQQAQQALETARHTLQHAQTQLHQKHLHGQTLEQHTQQAQERLQRLSQDMAGVQQQQNMLAQSQIQAHTAHTQAQQTWESAQTQYQALQDQLAQAEQTWTHWQAQHLQQEKQTQAAHFEYQKCQAHLEELRRTHTQWDAQNQTFSQDITQAQSELAALNDEGVRAHLQSALSLQAEREATLGQERSRYDELTAQLKQSDEKRLRAQQALDPLRTQVQQGALKAQAAWIKVEQAHEALQAMGAALPAQDACPPSALSSPTPAALEALHRSIDQLKSQIASLGAVNLAALEELGTARTRETFLSSQLQDLQTAITTLKNAILQIDQQSQSLLMSTFETVNQHFGEMFPRLFGGGHAKLVLTGADILDTGVQVWAQPPGKRNQTIQLLSGGEKALTAIALVFAIFQLNPAPFCLLDEVDAPLDDANTQRYADLVASMSTQTQFLFISHNRITMEMAQQLIGVTMQEQGASRIVSVNLAQAVTMRT